MSDLEKLEYIHSTLQECRNNNLDKTMIKTSLGFVEDIRNPHLEEKADSLQR